MADVPLWDDLRVRRAHREFLDGLVDAALEDAVVTDDEYDQLCRAAALLDVDLDVIARRVDGYRTSRGALDLTPGLEVCFTGSATDTDGREIERSELEAIATARGLVPKRSVTKGGGLLVAADPTTQSDKADKARKFGVPITSLDSFLRSLQTGEPLDVTRLASAGIPLVCAECGSSWLAARRSGQPRCVECKRSPAAKPTTTSGAQPASTPSIETLTCIECGNTSERERVRGRKPHRCTGCTDAETTTGATT